jgi:hypothetical protein
MGPGIFFLGLMVHVLSMVEHVECPYLLRSVGGLQRSYHCYGHFVDERMSVSLWQWSRLPLYFLYRYTYINNLCYIYL